MENTIQNPTEKSRRPTVKIIAILLVICTIVKYVEFLFIRTELTFIADNVFCKIFCIIAVLAALKIYGLKLSDIGFKNSHVFKYICCGFGLGILTFAASYGLEILVLYLQGKSPALSMYITNFGLTGATNEVTLSWSAVIICIIVNIINVLAEESLFRGFILKTITDKWNFKRANFIQALLFGAWHIVSCVLGVYDGQMSVIQAIVFAIGYIILAGVLAVEWGTCVNMTGVLWVGISEHFFNNFIGNFLHVTSTTGTDELQIIRIVLSNMLSLTIVLCINRFSRKKNNA